MSNMSYLLPIVYCQNYACETVLTRLYMFKQGNIMSHVDNCSLSSLMIPTDIPIIDSNANPILTVYQQA